MDPKKPALPARIFVPRSEGGAYGNDLELCGPPGAAGFIRVGNLIVMVTKEPEGVTVAVLYDGRQGYTALDRLYVSETSIPTEPAL